MKKLISYNIILILFLLSCYSTLAQESNVINYKKFRYTKFLSVGGSSFDVNGFPSSPSYTSLELRLGTGIVKSVGKYFDLKSGLNIGLKVKRKSYFFGPSRQFTYKPWAMPSLDEAASNRSHLFIDIPLSMQFNYPRYRLGLKGGLNFRFWAPNDKSVDVLTGRSEIGMLGGISYNLIKKINIGLEYYYGLTDIWGGSYYENNSHLIEYYVRNQFAQIAIEHTF
ncbi:MAG TPA: hypothetical protein PLM56_07685 [Cyclobacteriaceae bacterium]|jgi:hypothetical protein|nr:hypothetical protein [Cyclobacteriaceae bacterium]HRF33364.1 hypothetical protein [Cyclobacteriaceae bacterium]